MATQITFDGVSFQRDEIITTAIYDLQAPDRTLNIGKHARDDKSSFISEYFDQKRIQIEGYLTTTTTSGIRGLIDDFKQVCSRIEKQLDISRDGETRRYTATARTPNIVMERSETTQARFDVEFVLSDPFGYATTSLSGMRSQTLNMETQFLTISGTFPAEPTFIIDVLSGSVGSFRIENTTISGELLIAPTSAVNAGSSITIDTNQFTATVDGVEQNTAGVFPIFRTQQEGNNTLLTTISGNGFEVMITTLYTPKYL